MPIGILINCSVVILGGMLGKMLGGRLASRLKDSLTLIFGICAMFIGINSMIKVEYVSAVILSVIMGVIVGEILQLEKNVKEIFGKAIIHFENFQYSNREQPIEMLVSTAVLFCASGMGIFGVLTEGFTGDSTILISKSIIDFFTAIVFATQMGYLVSGIALPQFLIFISLFFVARMIMPFVTSTMINDFTACGGIITLVVGLRVCNIRKIPVMNMVPSMIFVMPLSSLWSIF